MTDSPRPPALSEDGVRERSEALTRASHEERWALLQPHLKDPLWREPVLRCVRQLQGEGRPAEAQQLVAALLGDGGAAPASHKENPSRVQTLAHALDTAAGQEEPVRKAIRDAFQVKTDREQRRVVEALGAVASQDARVRAVLGGLLDGVLDPGRWWSLHLGFLPNPDETPEGPSLPRYSFTDLLGAMARRDAGVRQALVERLDAADLEGQDVLLWVLRPLVGEDAWVRQALLQRLEDKNPAVRKNTLRTLCETAPAEAAVREALWAWLEEEDSDERVAAVSWLNVAAEHDESLRHALLGQLGHEDAAVREAILEAVVEWKNRDAKVREALLACLHDEAPDVRYLAAKALGPWVVDRDAEVREALVARLGRGPVFEDFEETAVIRALKAGVHEDARVRQALLARVRGEEGPVKWVAIGALRDAADCDDTVAHALLASLGHEMGRGRRDATGALGAVASRKAWVREALLTRLEDAEGQVRREAVLSLWPVVKSEERVREALLARLEDPEGWVRRAAVAVLKEMLGEDARVREALIRHLDDPDIAESVSDELRTCVNWDERVRQVFLERLEAERWEVREDAVKALSRVTDDDARVRQALITCLDDPQPEVREQAAEALSAKRDPELRPSQVQLLTYLKTESWQLRRSFLKELAEVLGGDPRVRQALVTGLEDPQPEVREQAAASLRALETLGRQDGAEVLLDARVREALLAHRGDVDPRVRQAILGALGVLAADDMQVREVLLEHLDDEDLDVRWRVLSRLHEVAQRDARVREALLARLDVEEKSAREKLIQVLSETVDRDERVREALFARLGTEPWRLREIILRALTRESCDGLVDGVRLLPWLDAPADTSPDAVRTCVAQAIARRAGQDERLRERVVALLGQPGWNLRLGAAITLALIPGEPPASVLLILASLLDDRRDSGDWLTRLDASEVLLGGSEREARERALACVLSALESGALPWLREPFAVRRNAVRVLGWLESEPRREEVLQRVLRVMREDPHAEVREDAYRSALRLLAEAPP